MTDTRRACWLLLLCSVIVGSAACDGAAGTVGTVSRPQPQACASSDECDATQPVCGIDGRCVGCSSELDCGSERPLCNHSTGACVACTSSHPCPESADTCTPEGSCERRCGPSAPCEGEQVCHPQLGVCGECSPSSMCGTDEPFCDPVSLRCVECTSDQQCRGERPACVAGSCERCFDRSHCPAGQRCSVDLECIDACTSDMDCTEGPLPHCDRQSGECVR